MKVIILVLVVLGVCYYFWWHQFCAWMDERKYRIRLGELLARTDIIQEDGQTRYKLAQARIPAEGVTVQVLYDGEVWHPVLQIQGTNKSFFGPVQVVVEVKGVRSYIKLQSKEVVRTGDRWMITSSSSLVDDILAEVGEVSLLEHVYVMVLGGDFVRTFRLEQDTLVDVQDMIELARMLNKR